MPLPLDWDGEQIDPPDLVASGPQWEMVLGGSSLRGSGLRLKKRYQHDLRRDPVGRDDPSNGGLFVGGRHVAIGPPPGGRVLAVDKPAPDTELMHAVTIAGELRKLRHRAVNRRSKFLCDLISPLEGFRPVRVIGQRSGTPFFGHLIFTMSCHQNVQI